MINENEQNKSDGPFTKILRPTLYGLVAILLVILANLLSDWLLGAAFHDRFGTLYIVIAILFVIVGIVVGLPYIQERFKRWYLIPILYVVAVLVFFWFIGRPGPDCSIKGESDQDIIMKTIEAEGTAVVDENLAMIQKIFAEDAIIIDATSGYNLQRDDWYSTLFKNKDFLEAEQFEFHPVSEKTTNDIRLFTSGSRGRYRDEGGVHQYHHEPGSNEWTLQKDECGCWVIVKFRFNVPTGE